MWENLFSIQWVVNAYLQITRLMAVPPIIMFMCRHPMVSSFDLSSVKDVMSAAAPLGEGLTEEFMDKFKTPILQGNLVLIVFL